MLTWHLVTKSVPILVRYIMESGKITMCDLDIIRNVTQCTNAMTAQCVVALVPDLFTLRLIIDRHVMSTVYESTCSKEKLFDN